MDLDIRDTHALHLAMAGAEYEYCPFMFWYPPAVCYYKHWGPKDEDGTNGDTSADGRDIVDHVPCKASAAAMASPSAKPSLLSLPPEVRLRIYYWAYMMSPIQPKELAAGYPIPMLCRYILHPLDPNLEREVEQEIENERVIVDLATSGPPRLSDGKADADDTGARDEEEEEEEEQTPAVREQNELQRAIAAERLTKERIKDKMREVNKNVKGLLSSDRPLAGIPTGLLRACRQIYFEARTLPFENNEFVFLNWFSSGLNAAAAVTKSQRPWQRLAMRYVRMEVMAEDLAREGALKKWADLCGGSDMRLASWAYGLRGMRLKVVGQVGRKHTETAQEAEDKYIDALEEEGGARRWVERGKLAEMKNLERLEIEVIKNAWGTEEKMAWCAEVEQALRELGSRAEVVSMARIV
ncbi:hypothetical protein ACQKWADRAFT_279700 [Trichoderma austrokoningii]